MNLPSLMSLPVQGWLLHAGAALLLTLVGRFLAGQVFTRLIKKAAATRNVWDDTLLEAGRKPVYLLIWVVGFSWMAEAVLKGTGSPWFYRFETIRDLLFIGLFCWALVSFIQAMEHHFLTYEHKKKPDQTSIIAFGRLLRIAVLITGVLVVLQNLGYSLSGVLAFGGVGGLAVGFAAKDMLANFLGGWMVYVDKPFRVGDWISSPDKNIEGTVEYIGWRQTRIRTFARRPLYVPNATFMTIAIENPSRMQNRRIKQTFGLRYGDSEKVGSVLADIRSYLQGHDEIDQQKTLMVNFLSFGASSLDCQIYCFTRTTDWAIYRQVQEQVLLEVVNIIHRHGADIAFPTRTLDFTVDSSPQESVTGSG